MRSFSIQCADSSVEVKITPCPMEEDGIEIYQISVRLPRRMIPPSVTVEWKEPMRELLRVWHPLTGSKHVMHQSWHSNHSDSCFHCGAPILTLIGDQDCNQRTLSLSDPITPSSLRFGILDLEQKNQVGYSVILFDGSCEAMTCYDVLLRIDGRRIPYGQAVRQVYPWWAEHGFEIPSPPAQAEDPVYSTWYNFHQEPRQEELLAELRLAAELGFRTVILDDGWQISGRSDGTYANCGEWEVSADRFPDFKGFCEEVHGLGMKLAVWFAVPFIGKKSSVYPRFLGRYLKESQNENGHGILDPRFPEVRAYIRGNYERFLREYDVDGFKLDFIDAFMAEGEIPPYDPERMDCEAVGEAVLRLLSEIGSSLSAIKSDLLYEYRQRYVGPAINRFGNMLRVGDCAYDAHINRVEIVNLRLLEYPNAIHSDMLFWAPEESIKLCSRQLLNILFAVPQISVLLNKSTREQKELLRAYLSYWKANRHRILHGEFRAEGVERNFTEIFAEDGEGVLAVLYGDSCYLYDGRPAHVHHNGDRDGLVLENPTDDTLTVRLSTYFGERVLACHTVFPNSIVRLPLPQTGMAEIERART